MPTEDKIQHRMGLVHGTTAQLDEYTGLTGEVTVDVELNQIRRHDGNTKGGVVIYGDVLKSLKSRVTALEGRVDGHDVVISDLQGRVDGHDTDLSSVGDEVVLIKQRLDELELNGGGTGGTGDTGSGDVDLTNIENELVNLSDRIDTLAAEGGSGEEYELLVSNGINVKGKLNNENELPSYWEYVDGDTFVIDGHYFTRIGEEWVDLGDMRGADGKSAYELAVIYEGFTGTYGEWIETLKGADGTGIVIRDTLYDMSALPSLNMETGDAYIIDEKMYVWDSERWSPVGRQGPTGKSAYDLAKSQGKISPSMTIDEYLDSLSGKNAYQLARENGDIPDNWSLGEYLDTLKGDSAYTIAVKHEGYLGSETDWLTSLKGDKGDRGLRGYQGEKGDPSHAIKVLGKVETFNDLPPAEAPGDAYYIERHLWVYNGERYIDVGEVVGPQGERGLQGPKGIPGDQGQQGLSAYEVAIKNNVFDGSEIDFIESLKGKSAYEIAKSLDYADVIIDEEDWLKRLQGKDAYQTAVDLNLVSNLNEWREWSRGPKGETGPQGVMGHGLEISGYADTEADLPHQPKEYAAWIMGENLFVYTNGLWVDMGKVRGPRGEKGLEGKKGDKGDTGRGLNILGSFARQEDLPSIDVSTLGDAYLIENDLWVRIENGWRNTGTVRGPQGMQGPIGMQGGRGPKGEQGRSGRDGKTGRPGGIGRTGPQGPQGIQGEPGRDGDLGPGIQIMGRVEDVSELPNVASLGEGYIMGQNLWAWDGLTWQNFGTFVGPRGRDGATGPPGADGRDGRDGRDGVDGQDGIDGVDGQDGDPAPSLVIVGEVEDRSELPPTGNRGDAYIADGTFFVWDGSKWINVGFLQGPPGKDGAPGKDGKAAPRLRVLGEVDHVDDIPTAAPNVSDAWLINGDFWFWTGYDWINAGRVQGPVGPEGPQGERGMVGPGLTIKGSYETVEMLPDTYNTPGDAYMVGPYLYTWGDNSWNNAGQIKGPKGDTGPKGEDGLDGLDGEVGPALNIKGSVANIVDLPDAGNERGDGFMIGPKLYTWDGLKWNDVGPIQGPKGDAGPIGPEGPQGEAGPIGPKGSAWLTFDHDPGAVHGVVGDYAINTLTNHFFFKATDLLWEEQGRLGGGTVGEAPLDFYQYVRRNGEWKQLTVDVGEAPTDGQNYIRREGQWVPFESDFKEPPMDGEVYGRVNGRWEMVTFNEAPMDGGNYTRINGEWAPFDRYTLLNEEADTALDLTVSQTFTVFADMDKELHFTNAPSGERTMTVIVTIVDSDGVITWPANVTFKDDTPPTLGTNYTIVAFYWTGFMWVGKLIESL